MDILWWSPEGTGAEVMGTGDMENTLYDVGQTPRHLFLVCLCFIITTTHHVSQEAVRSMWDNLKKDPYTNKPHLASPRTNGDVIALKHLYVIHIHRGSILHRISSFCFVLFFLCWEQNPSLVCARLVVLYLWHISSASQCHLWLVILSFSTI